MRTLRDTLLALVLFLLMGGVLPTALASPPNNPNDPGYWGDDCIKVEPVGTPTWTADQDYRLVVLKYATTNQEFYDVKAGDVLATATGQDISHLILCTGEEPPSSTTTTTSTTTTSTTAPPTTTTTSTTTTSQPPASSITTTSTTVPPTINIDIDIICDNLDSSGTSAREPIITYWSGTYRDHQDANAGTSTHGYEVWIRVLRDGEVIGTIEQSDLLPTYGQHDNWLGPDVPIYGEITAIVYINGEPVSESSVFCGGPTSTTVVDPPPSTVPPPPTGVPTGDGGYLPGTGLPVGALLLAIGLLSMVGGAVYLGSLGGHDWR